MSPKRLNQKVAAGRPRKAGPLALLVKLGLFVLVISYGVSLLFSRVERDPTTLCRLDNRFLRETAILLDETDGYSRGQAASIARYLENMLANSLVDEKFTFYSLGPSVNSFFQDFYACNPGSELDQSDLSPEQRIQYREWDADFLARLTVYVDALIDRSAADNSPIMEMIQYVANQNPYADDETEKRLILVSNLIHNTAEFSHYRDTSNFGAVSGDQNLSRLLAPLSDVDVEILFVQRPQLLAIQNRSHIESFWRPYVNASGGRIVSVDRIDLE